MINLLLKYFSSVLIKQCNMLFESLSSLQSDKSRIQPRPPGGELSSTCEKKTSCKTYFAPYSEFFTK